MSSGSSFASSSKPPKRQKSSLSVVIVEDHNEVLHYWYRAIGSKKLPFENGTVVHFDSHPDLMIPSNFDSSKILDRDYVLSSLSIENWILPAVYAKHFNSVAWIKPQWATQIEEGIHCFKIGHHRDSKEIKVTCPQSYFVSELSWCPSNELEAAHDVTLEVCTLRETHGDASKNTLSCFFVEELKNQAYVLDIDLDFFSTKNPFLSMFTESQFDILRDLFHYEHPPIETPEALHRATENRREQLHYLRALITELGKKCGNFSSPDSSCQKGDGEEEQKDEKWTVVEIDRRKALREKVQNLMATYDGDPNILFDAGCTCDDCDLPHHVSSRDEILQLINITAEFLRPLPKPALISISRSSRDDYCPPEDVEFIQDNVICMLQSLYGDLDILKDYELEELESSLPSTST